ncbi:MAG TPA: hypothetical protein VNM47_06995 [Terriglobia bacterium]|nr:hypothetical protein [Terriglobia bacterium]
MKTIRNLMILSGLCLVLFALAAAGARAQTFASTSFTGTFTLPVETHWGAMTLPAGDYTLRYGIAFSSTYLVTVDGEEEGSPRGMILPRARDDASGVENVLNCIREGDILYVRAVELPAIGESIHFKIPHGVEVKSKLLQRQAKHANESGNTQLAETRIAVERVPAR